MRLIIHAGIHRTGTTTLQYALSSSRDGLRDRGILYPGNDIHHQSYAWSLFERVISGAELRNRLLAEVTPQVSTVVLSGEDFCIHDNLEWVRELRRSFDVEVAFYLRRQDLWLASWYNQHVKWPFDERKSELSPQEFVRTLNEYHWLDYERLLKRWENAVGFNNVHVGVIERGQTGDVVADFARILCLAEGDLAADRARENDSLPVAALEIARHMGLHDMADRERDLIVSALRRAFGGRPERGESVFAPAERLHVLRQFDPSNSAVARRYFGRDELFYAKWPTFDEPHFAFPEVGRQDLLREWVAPFVRELIRRPEELGDLP